MVTVRHSYDPKKKLHYAYALTPKGELGPYPGATRHEAIGYALEMGYFFDPSVQILDSEESEEASDDSKPVAKHVEVIATAH